MLDNPQNKAQIAAAFIVLYTRYSPSEEETSKFIDFLFQGKVIPSTLNFKDALLYMLTYDSNFDLNDKDEYGMNPSKNESALNSNIESHRSQSTLKSKFKIDFKGIRNEIDKNGRNYSNLKSYRKLDGEENHFTERRDSRNRSFESREKKMERGVQERTIHISRNYDTIKSNNINKNEKVETMLGEYIKSNIKKKGSHKYPCFPSCTNQQIHDPLINQIIFSNQLSINPKSVRKLDKIESKNLVLESIIMKRNHEVSEIKKSQIKSSSILMMNKS